MHRVDMRLRLGLLQDPAAIERQIARELADVEARRKKAAIPTAKTEAQTKRDEERLKKEKQEIEKKASRLPRVRPLSEAKAIDSGANFISEAFLFFVAGGIIVFEFWRSKRKENDRRDTVAERLEGLESENDNLRHQLELIESALQQKGIPLHLQLEARRTEPMKLITDGKEQEVKEQETAGKSELQPAKNSDQPAAVQSRP